jgi:hypothetical protein
MPLWVAEMEAGMPAYTAFCRINHEPRGIIHGKRGQSRLATDSSRAGQVCAAPPPQPKKLSYL